MILSTIIIKFKVYNIRRNQTVIFFLYKIIEFFYIWMKKLFEFVTLTNMLLYKNSNILNYLCCQKYHIIEIFFKKVWFIFDNLG